MDKMNDDVDPETALDYLQSTMRLRRNCETILTWTDIENAAMNDSFLATIVGMHRAGLAREEALIHGILMLAEVQRKHCARAVERAMLTVSRPIVIPKDGD